MIAIITFLPLLSAFIAFSLHERHIRKIEFTTIFVMGVVLALSVASSVAVGNGAEIQFMNWLKFDALSAFLALIVSIIGTNAVLYSSGYFKEETRKGYVQPRKIKQYYTQLNVFLFAMFLATTTTSPVLAWIAIEATTLSTIFLISFYDKNSAIEAAWKYAVINSIGLLLGFLGMMLLIASTGISTGYVSWSSLLSAASGASPLALSVAFLFILVGFGTKAGLAPMHTWLPDAHSKAPVPVSALLSGVLLNVALVAVVRFKGIVDVVAPAHFTDHLFIALGLLSVGIVGFTILTQRHYKRLFAYSSIENMGLIAIGIGVGGIGIFGALLHMLYHALSKSLLFFASGNIFLKYGSTKISDITGAIKTLPQTAVLFFVGIFIITGLPPFGIFASKFAILSQVADVSMYLLIGILAFLILIFIGFLKHAQMMLFGNAPDNIEPRELHQMTLVPIYITVFVIILFSVYIPTPIEHLINQAALFISGKIQ
jgi:hydrogenase-4 component F